MRWTARVSQIALFSALAGCGGADKGSDSDSDASTQELQSFTFNSTVNAKNVDSEVSGDALINHQVVNTVLSAINVVMSDVQVRERLGVDNGPGRRTSHCWSGPAAAMTEFTLDFTGCANAGMSGGVFVKDTPQGPVIFEFLNFTFEDTRKLTGTVAFDSAAATGSYEWAVYDTISSAPSPTTPSPVGVTLDGTLYSFAFDGGGNLDLMTNTWHQWGVATVTSVSSESTLLVGGTDAATLTGLSEPPTTMTSPLLWTSCRCPYAGTTALDLALDIEEVTIDLDKLIAGDEDEIDDPDLSFAVSGDLMGALVLERLGCGEYGVTYTPDSLPTVTLSSAELQAAIEHECDIAVISDEQRCVGLLSAAAEIGSVEVAITDLKVTNTVEDVVATEFDGGFCRIE